MDDDWRTRVDCTGTGCLRAPLLSDTETINWRKVYVAIPIMRNNRIVEGMSIPIVRNNTVVKGISTPIVQNNRFNERYIDTYLLVSLETIGLVSQSQ